MGRWDCRCGSRDLGAASPGATDPAVGVGYYRPGVSLLWPGRCPDPDQRDRTDDVAGIWRWAVLCRVLAAFYCLDRAAPSLYSASIPSRSARGVWERRC